jgi:hypothetical protein
MFASSSGLASVHHAQGGKIHPLKIDQTGKFAATGMNLSQLKTILPSLLIQPWRLKP